MIKDSKRSSWVFGVGMLFVILGVLSALFDNVAGGTVSIVAGFFLIIVTQLDLKSFKIFGLEAELIEKISEAEAILERLRKISVPISEISVSTATRMGRNYRVVPNADLYDLVNKVTEGLRGMNVSEADVEKIKSDWYYYIAIEFVKPIREKLNQLRSPYFDRYNSLKVSFIGCGDSAERTENEKLLQRFIKEGEQVTSIFSKVPGRLAEDVITQFRGFLNSCTSISNTEKEILFNMTDEWEDVDYFLKHKKIRRLEKWLEQ